MDDLIIFAILAIIGLANARSKTKDKTVKPKPSKTREIFEEFRRQAYQNATTPYEKTPTELTPRPVEQVRADAQEGEGHEEDWQGSVGGAWKEEADDYQLAHAFKEPVGADGGELGGSLDGQLTTIEQVMADREVETSHEAPLILEVLEEERDQSPIEGLLQSHEDLRRGMLLHEILSKAKALKYLE